MSNACLIVTCGLPASGKSTFCHRLCQSVKGEAGQRLQKDTDGARQLILSHICFDKLLDEKLEQELIAQSITGEASHKGEAASGSNSEVSEWKMYRMFIQTCISNFIYRQISNDAEESAHINFQQFAEDIDRINHILDESLVSVSTHPDTKSKKMFIFIIDDNMYYQSMRYGYYQLAREYEIGFCQLYFPCSSAVALQRNQERPTKVLDDVIIAMEKKLEAPAPEKNPWEKYTLVMDRDTSEECVLELVQQAMMNPVKKLPPEDTAGKEESRLVCSESVIHQTDQILRKLVTESMRNAKGRGSHLGMELKTYAKVVNDVKRDTLKDIRELNIFIPCGIQDAVCDAAADKTNPLHIFIQEIFTERVTTACKL